MSKRPNSLNNRYSSVTTCNAAKTLAHRFAVLHPENRFTLFGKHSNVRPPCPACLVQTFELLSIG